MKKICFLSILVTGLAFVGYSLWLVKTREPLLIKAINSKYPFLFSYYLLIGADPNAQTHDGLTALMEAATWCAKKEVEQLLNAGADPNQKTVYGETALMMIGSNGSSDSYEIAKMLIDHGADVTAVSQSGHTALENARNIALVLGDNRLVSLLESRMPSPTPPADSKLIK